MSDSEEDSSNSENNWPMNEDWMLNILKDDDKSEAKVKINVINRFFFHYTESFAAHAITIE